MIVSLEEFERWHTFRDAINAFPLTEIVWTRDGVPVDVSSELVAEFAESGLSNFSFPFIAGLAVDALCRSWHNSGYAAGVDDSRYDNLEDEDDE